MSQSKAEIIAERQANLELPDQPPVASDWNSADASINAGTGERQDDISFVGSATGMREPASMDSGARSSDGADLSNVGREGKDGLSGPPSDAVTADKRDAKGTADTMGKDYGYPQKNDPSSGKA